MHWVAGCRWRTRPCAGRCLSIRRWLGRPKTPRTLRRWWRGSRRCRPSFTTLRWWVKTHVCDWRVQREAPPAQDILRKMLCSASDWTSLQVQEDGLAQVAVQAAAPGRGGLLQDDAAVQHPHVMTRLSLSSWTVWTGIWVSGVILTLLLSSYRHRATNMFLDAYKRNWLETEGYSFEDKMIDDLSVRIPPLCVVLFTLYPEISVDSFIFILESHGGRGGRGGRDRDEAWPPSSADSTLQPHSSHRKDVRTSFSTFYNSDSDLSAKTNSRMIFLG